MDKNNQIKLNKKIKLEEARIINYRKEIKNKYFVIDQKNL